MYVYTHMIAMELLQAPKSSSVVLVFREPNSMQVANMDTLRDVGALRISVRFWGCVTLELQYGRWT